MTFAEALALGVVLALAFAFAAYVGAWDAAYFGGHP